MSSYKPEQRRLAHRGREFHFVSYEAQPGNVRRQEAAVPAMWYLMEAGKRWPALPLVQTQADPELEAALRHWVDVHVFVEAIPAVARVRAATGRSGRSPRRSGKRPPR